MYFRISCVSFKEKVLILGGLNSQESDHKDETTSLVNNNEEIYKDFPKVKIDNESLNIKLLELTKAYETMKSDKQYLLEVIDRKKIEKRTLKSSNEILIKENENISRSLKKEISEKNELIEKIEKLEKDNKTVLSNKNDLLKDLDREILENKKLKKDKENLIEQNENISRNLKKEISEKNEFIEKIKRLEKENKTVMSDIEKFKKKLKKIKNPKGDHILVVGGRDHKSVSTYSFEKPEWKQMKDMANKRQGHACIFDGQTRFVVGGSNCNRIDAFKDNELVEMISFEKSLKCFAICDYGNKFMIAGGNNGQETLDSCWLFDSKTHEICELDRMEDERRNFSLVECHGSVYALGGWDPWFSALDSIEVYSKKEKT